MQVDLNGLTEPANRGEAALSIAAAARHTSVIKLLLAAKASVDQANKNGFTPLMYSSWNGDVGSLELLLAAKSSVDLATNQPSNHPDQAIQDELNKRFKARHPQVVGIGQEGNVGVTALMAASHNKVMDVVVIERLLAARASIAYTNLYGHSPLSLARRKGHRPSIELLETWLLLKPLMRAVLLRDQEDIKALLHLCTDPTHTVSLELPHGGEYVEMALRADDYIHPEVFGLNDPSLWLSGGSHSAWSLATATRTWFSDKYCADTMYLVQRSLTWSMHDSKAIYLFPPMFRRGVRHVCGLKVALDRGDRKVPIISNNSWMVISAHVPRDWGI